MIKYLTIWRTLCGFYLVRSFENRRCRWQIDLQVWCEVVGSHFQGDESARTLSTLVKDTGAREWHRRIRYDWLNVDEGNRALCGVLPSIARCEVQVLILPGVWYVRHRIANRYVGFGVFQLDSENRNIQLVNSVIRKIKSFCQREKNLTCLSRHCYARNSFPRVELTIRM